MKIFIIIKMIKSYILIFFLIILHGIMVNILSYSIHIFSILKYVFCLLFLPSFLIVFIHIDQNLE